RLIKARKFGNEQVKLVDEIVDVALVCAIEDKRVRPRTTHADEVAKNIDRRRLVPVILAVLDVGAEFTQGPQVASDPCAAGGNVAGEDVGTRLRQLPDQLGQTAWHRTLLN